jgi:superfamily I DNA and/or RNA helicase
LRPNYVELSFYDYAHSVALQSNHTSVFLAEHYRCHPEIINFCNNEFYERELGQTMEIRTKAEDFAYGEKGVHWVHVNGEMAKASNLNQAEVSKCIELAGMLSAQYPEASIGIITPFRDQKLALQKKLAAEMPGVAVADTVHRFQGDEKDIIILSTVVSTDCPEGKTKFINRNAYLLNVAITRARSTLYVVGNHSYCVHRNGKGPQPLASLAEYAKELNHVSLA